MSEKWAQRLFWLALVLGVIDLSVCIGDHLKSNNDDAWKMKMENRVKLQTKIEIRELRLLHAAPDLIKELEDGNK